MTVPVNSWQGVTTMMTVKKQYEFNPETDLIGQGGFGKVYKARDVNLDLEVAIKKYAGNLPNKYSLFEEIKRVIKFSHPNLVRYYDAFELTEPSMFGDSIQVGVLEYINGGDLMRLLKQQPSLTTLTGIFEGIMLGLQFLHSKKIIHRDLKPENVLIQRESDGKYTPKIADFGISKVISESRSGNSSLVIGSIEYMAPEQFNVKKYGINQQLHTNLDLWSLGTIIYEAFVGEAPFGKTKQGFARDEIMRNILLKDLDNLDKIPQPFRTIVERCLVRDAKARARSVDELLQIFYSGIASNNELVGATSVIGQAATSVLKDVVNSSNSYIPPTPNIKQPKQHPGIEKYTVKKSELPVEKSQFSGWSLVPIFTAILGFGLFYFEEAIFGALTKEEPGMLAYPAFACAGLVLLNIFSLIIRRPKAHEIMAYLMSFTVIGYCLGLSANQYYYISTFNDVPKQLDFQRFYPLIAFGLVTFTWLVRIVQARWFEMIFALLTYAALLFYLEPIMDVITLHWKTILGGLSALCLTLAAIFAYLRR